MSEGQIFARRDKPSDPRGALCDHRSSGQLGWSRHLTQAEGMPPRPGCELIGAGPMAGGYPGRIRTPMSSVHWFVGVDNLLPSPTL